MRLLLFSLCLAACAGPVWAGLDRVQAVTCEAGTVGTLARVEAVGSVVPHEGAVSSLPCFERLIGSEALAGTVPCVMGLAGSVPPIGGDLPYCAGIGAVAVQQVDPFLTWFDIWSDGALGELRAAAVEAAKRGDDAAYRKLAARYWAGLAIATERRRALAEESGGDASSLRGSRRSRY